MPPIDLQKLRYFLEVIDKGSFTRAAASLGVVQSALSRHVRDLEQQFGQPLLYRTGRGVIATDFANQFLSQIRALTVQADQLADDIEASRGNVVGTVCLGILGSLSGLVLTPFLTEITDRFPQIQIRVREGLTDHVEEWLTTGSVDLGLIYGDNSPLRQYGKQLVTADLYLVGAGDEPVFSKPTVPLTKAARFPMILPAPPNRWRLTVDSACANYGVSLSVAHELDSLETIKRLVQSGLRYSILPRHAFIDELRTERLRASRIVQPTISREVILVPTPRRKMSRAAAEVATILQRQFMEHVASDTLCGDNTKPSGSGRT